jgi:hypothetical protein
MKTTEGKWVLFDLATGKQGEFWPIDARRLLEIGSHSTEAPQGATVVAPPVAPRNVGVPKTAVAKHAEVGELGTVEVTEPVTKGRSTAKKE